MIAEHPLLATPVESPLPLFHPTTPENGTRSTQAVMLAQATASRDESERMQALQASAVRFPPQVSPLARFPSGVL
jgi:hypothetical protein